MIFYFSGNGNSKWVAERLGAATGDTVADMMRLTDDEARAMVDSARRVGLVFPIHSWDAPVPVKRFVRDVLRAPLPYTYVVCTCGDDAGKAMQRLGRLLGIDAAWSVQMPNTYVPMFDLDAPELARQKVADARTFLPAIAEAVVRKEHAWCVHEGGFPRCKTYVVYPLFKHFCVKTKAFRVDNACISCGRCEQNCPVSAIRLVDGRPVWNKACIHCMACLHGCPVNAISYGAGTKKKGQYRLEDYL